MTKPLPSLDAALEIWGDLNEFGRSGSKEAYRKRLGEEFLRRLGPSAGETLAAAMMSLATLRQTLLASEPSRKRVARSPKPRKDRCRGGSQKVDDD
jgi:hypothetical protein